MKQRIITGMIGGAIFLLLLWLGGSLFSATITILALFGLHEFMRMANMKRYTMASIIGYLFLLLMYLPSLHTSFSLPVSGDESIYILTLLLLGTIVSTKNRFSIEQAGVLLIALLYIGFGFYTFLEARQSHGFAVVLFILLIIWCTDSGAYFVGKRFGARKLWPSISPNKTIEGSIGGIIVAVMVALIFQSLTHLFDSFTELLIVSLVISTVGQIGDLVESALKRYYHVKDSGTLLPGHGGVLDRFDSLLFVFPVLSLLQLI